MLELRRLVALGVDVGDFLYLERSLERHGVQHPAPDEEHVVRLRVLLRDFRDRLVPLEHLLDEFGETRDFLDKPVAVLEG